MLDPELESFYGAVTADITANTAALARWDKQVNFEQFSLIYLVCYSCLSGWSNAESQPRHRGSNKVRVSCF